MADKQLMAEVEKLRKQVKALGSVRAFRKLHGVLKALEMQVEDGDYQRHAVARLCEALLATRELYCLPEEAARDLENTACKVVTLVEERR
jgi:hypothetical protein